METSAQREETLRASRQAAEWLGTLENAGERERQAFVDWLGRSALHVQEFLNLSAIDRYLDHVPADYPLDVAALRGAETNRVAPLQRQIERTARSSSRRSWLAGIAAAAASIAVGLWTAGLFQQQRYSTEIGEQRSIELDDGSLIHLNARSSVAIHFSSQAREVELLRGEALFNVKPDSSRPFSVQAGDTAIQVLGTEFNVYRHERGTTVAVLNGKVRIAGASGTLTAGDEARVSEHGEIALQKQPDVTKATVWRQRRLIFDATPLPEIAEEFNRYNRRPQLRIEGSEAQSRRFTGVFDADDPESLVALLEKDGRLSIQRGDSELLIRGR